MSLSAMILSAIKQETPFAVARYGDGEYAICVDCYLTEDCYNVHLGYVPSSKERDAIKNGILNSIHGLDVIGITDSEEDIWGDSKVYFEGLAEQPIVTLDFHTYFTENGITERLLWSAEKVLYISGHTLNLDKFRFKDVIHLEIPLQSSKYKEDRKYYPEIFDDTMRKISTLNLRGYLCLVGAGFVGKPFMMAIKNQGGVAVDLGSNMDKLAGYVIRGSGAHTAVKSDKYKL